MKKLLLLSLLLTACLSPKTNENTNITNDDDFIDYVSLCVEFEFNRHHNEIDIIKIHTVDIENYWLSDVYYKPYYQNDIYKTEYMSAVNDKNELIVKEVLKK